MMLLTTRIKWFIVPVVLLLAAGCFRQAVHPSLRAATLPELIAGKAWVSNPDNKFDYTISPDGKKLAWITRVNNWNTIQVKTVEGEDVVTINSDCWCHVSDYQWAQDSRHIIFSVSTGAGTPDSVFLADTESPLQKPLDLAPNVKWYAGLVQTVVSDPATVFLSYNRRCTHCFDLYKTNIFTGDKELIARSDKDVWQWIVAQDGDLFGCIRVAGDNKIQLERFHPSDTSFDGSWEVLFDWTNEESVTFKGISHDKKYLWLISNRGRDKAVLVAYDVTTGKERVLQQDDLVDVESVFMHPVDARPLIAYAYPDYPKVYPLDPDVKKAVEAFNAPDRSGFTLLSMDHAATKFTAAVYDEKGSAYYLYDIEKNIKTLLGRSGPAVRDDITCGMEPVSFESRDGLRLNGYVTYPRGAPRNLLPTVLLVHGGPWARDYWGYNEMAQFFANRGYLVLQVNFRGSEGYGRAFLKAAKNEFSGKMQEDLLDAVNWAVNHGIADPGKIAIVGWSYGGFAALAGLAFTPEVFTCGISINGISDVYAYLETLGGGSVPDYKKPGRTLWYEYIDDPHAKGAKENIDKLSPLYAANRVTRPALVVHGGHDDVVNVEQSDKMVRALRDAGKEVTYLQLPTDGHSIEDIESREKLYHQMELFLAQHLGGRRLH